MNRPGFTGDKILREDLLTEVEHLRIPDPDLHKIAILHAASYSFFPL